jgi:hypothetical protein
MFKAVYFHRTVRAAELMLVKSMKLADAELGLTDLSDLGRYLDLTDEVVLHRLSTLEGRDRKLKEARRLARDFLGRRLVKCVFEKVVQRRDSVVEQLFLKSRMRDQVTANLAREAKVDRMHVYLDVPTTPSVPYTYTREALTHIKVFRREGRRTVTEALPIGELPLVGSIAGFMDVVRVYASPEHRGAVERATRRLFGDEGYMTKISV